MIDGRSSLIVHASMHAGSLLDGILFWVKLDQPITNWQFNPTLSG